MFCCRQSYNKSTTNKLAPSQKPRLRLDSSASKQHQGAVRDALPGKLEQPCSGLIDPTEIGQASTGVNLRQRRPEMDALFAVFADHFRQIGQSLGDLYPGKDSLLQLLCLFVWVR